MRVTFWGVRGSIPVPSTKVAGFGGNTSCVQVTTSGGSEIILDAGTGIRELSATLAERCRRVHILLTHLHLDHIQGLLFFAPFFQPDTSVTVWGPPGRTHTLRARLARYLSSPLSPIEIRDLPATVTFAAAPDAPWRLDGVEVSATLVAHRGATLGYRLTENGHSVVYMPDHEPGLGQDLAHAPAGWISGMALARGASLLLHDGQYTDAEYRVHRGWGHSRVSDALTFARRAEVKHLVLTHHDPGRDDGALAGLGQEAEERWAALGGEGPVEMAREGRVIDLDA